MIVKSGISFNNIHFSGPLVNPSTLYGVMLVDSTYKLFKFDEKYNIEWQSSGDSINNVSEFFRHGQYLYSGGSSIYKTDVNTGSTVEILPDAYYGNVATGIAADDTGIYIISTVKDLFKFSDSGNLLWRQNNLGTLSTYDLSYSNNKVFIPGARLYCVSGSDGSILWSVGGSDLEPLGHSFISNFTAVYSDDSFVYALGRNYSHRSVYKFDQEGNLVWVSDYNECHYDVNVYGIHANKHGEIVTCAYDGTVIKYDSDGNVLWQSELIEQFMRDVVITDNGEVFTTSGSNLYKIDPDGGTIIETYSEYSSHGIYLDK